MILEEAIRKIPGPDPDAAAEARRRLDGLAKPLGSLGLLEDAIVKIAAITGNARIFLKQRSLLVFCADNGVIAQGVSQSGADVTAAVTTALALGTSTVNYMAASAGCSVYPVDIGVRDLDIRNRSDITGCTVDKRTCSDITGRTVNKRTCDDIAGRILDRRIRSGTADISLGPAMSREECIRAIETGIELVRERQEAGDDILLLGEMGIGNTTTSCAVLCALLGLPARDLAGRGAGLSDEGLDRKIHVIERALQINHPDPDDPVDILQKVGGLDLAALCGVIIGGAHLRMPILLDGLITNTAALCAVRLCPPAGSVLLASHVSAEPASRQVLEALSLKPLIDAGMRLGEGSGAVAALPLLDIALAVYNSGHTFGHLGIEAYQPLS